MVPSAHHACEGLSGYILSLYAKSEVSNLFAWVQSVIFGLLGLGYNPEEILVGEICNKDFLRIVSIF